MVAQSQAAELQAETQRLTGLAMNADATVQDYVSALQVLLVVHWWPSGLGCTHASWPWIQSHKCAHEQGCS